ncbi:hypothetical protein SAMN05660297_01567 [Natronincola peptidivorans]|uniref:Uncharacterized protein n=1 Tax=Natronincola peptidivorans TaxID=426128 RepID=A0A1I0CBZ8_9FIRM|nr:hypothetical protein [Natronincola peptidivorans]SET16654.1 hypothetical protein SAMN05660297_01567 [Natronincola peptidivorans]
MISTVVPTVIYIALIAVEYANYPDFSSQTVMFSTMYSAVSLVAVIYAARIPMPIL